MRAPAGLDVEAPITIGTIETAGGRRLEYAEFGDTDGVPVLWGHQDRPRLLLTADAVEALTGRGPRLRWAYGRRSAS